MKLRVHIVEAGIKNPRVFLNGKECKIFKGIPNGEHSRCSYIYKNIIIKLDDEYQQSTKELQNLKFISKKDLKYFPKVYGGEDCDENLGIPGWIAEERLFPVLGRRSDAAKEIIIKLTEKYHFEDIFHYDPFNWMLTKKGPVIYDWAI